MFAAVAACAIPTVFAADVPPATTPEPITVIKAGKLIDVAMGRVRNDQVIIVQDGKISAVGAAGVTAVPPGATRAPGDLFDAGPVDADLLAQVSCQDGQAQT